MRSKKSGIERHTVLEGGLLECSFLSFMQSCHLAFPGLRRTTMACSPAEAFPLHLPELPTPSDLGKGAFAQLHTRITWKAEKMSWVGLRQIS